MGIYIHRKLGWILKYNKNEVKVHELRDLLDDLTFNDFKKYLYSIPEYANTVDNRSLLTSNPITDLNHEIINTREDKKDKITYKSKLSEVVQVIYNGEDLSPYILFSSILCKTKWNHFDSPIDYYEQGGEAKLKVNWLFGREIYPYVQPFVVTETLKEIERLDKDAILTLVDSRKDQLRPEFKNRLLEYGFDFNQKSIKNQMHMQPSGVIRSLFDFLFAHHKMATEKMKNVTHKRLIPGIITYWG